MRGKIIKGIAGFYYVHAQDGKIYECKARGIFRKDKIKPLVGDDVEMDVLSQAEKEGNIREILPRQNALIRPAVANIDQALIIFAITSPAPNLNLLDRFLIMMQKQGLSCIICFNKEDMAEDVEAEALQEAYKQCGCPLLFTSAQNGQGIEEIRRLLRKKTTAVAGPSGVGKSSLINCLQPKALMETGEVSEKIGRGKHTTRHSELIFIEENTYIMDTPGFSFLAMFDMKKEELKDFYPEFAAYEDGCRFQGCVHKKEPGCMVKQALEEGKISRLRYENYISLYGELENTRRY